MEQTDVHRYEETRQLGKAGNFGLVFGMYEDGFVVYARANYHIELTREEAHAFRESFFQGIRSCWCIMSSTSEYAREHKFVRTPLGRIRHLPLIKSQNREVAAKAERQAINSPVQGHADGHGPVDDCPGAQVGSANAGPVLRGVS